MAGYDYHFLGGLLRDGLYIVPEYQRFYSWERNQWQDIWDDINSIRLSGSADHYCGTVVVERLAEQKSNFGRTLAQFRVVDGQQRLVTLSILLFTICSRLKELNVETATRTAANVLRDYIFDQDLSEYKLQLNGDDAGFYRDCVIRATAEAVTGKEPATHSQRRLLRAKQFFHDLLSSGTHEYLDELLKKITTKLIFIRYEVGSDIEAGMVFEAMNDRGRPLTQVDKIKNYLIFLAYKEDDRDLGAEINSSFGEIYGNIMRVDAEESSEDKLLRYHWTMYAGGSESDISRAVKARFHLRSSDLKSRIREYVSSLKEASFIFLHLNRPDDFFSGDMPAYSEIRTHLNSLHRVKSVANFFPVLIAARICFKQDMYKFRDICRLCEITAVRLHKILNLRTDTGAFRFHHFAHRFFQSAHDQPNAAQDYRQFTERVRHQISSRGSEYLVRVNLERTDFYDAMEPYEIKYLLYEFEKTLAHSQGEPVLAWHEVERKCEIEHVLSQSPRDKTTWSEEMQGLHWRHVNKFGNLTLTFWNKDLSNKSFAEKKAKYNDSKLVVQRQLAGHEEWGPDQISERTKRLVEFVLRRWPDN